MHIIKEYTVIDAIPIDDFRIIVNRYIKAGWQPYGPSQVTPANDSTIRHFYQAMVKYE